MLCQTFRKARNFFSLESVVLSNAYWPCWTVNVKHCLATIPNHVDVRGSMAIDIKDDS